jgi:hypothetical protein
MSRERLNEVGNTVWEGQFPLRQRHSWPRNEICECLCSLPGKKLAA